MDVDLYDTGIVAADRLAPGAGGVPQTRLKASVKVMSAQQASSVLIIKLNAAGDVVRTTSLLRCLRGSVTWITQGPNVELIANYDNRVRCLDWTEREQALGRSYDLVINLEDEVPAAGFAMQARGTRLFGAYLDGESHVAYSEDSRHWFDLSLISSHGRERADQLKLVNRRTYQELVFEGLGFSFAGERYVLPPPSPTMLVGDVALAPVAGPVWPMKGWAYYDALKAELESAGLQVNVLPRRATLLEHMGDVANHRCLVSGDSLPMHFALATGTPCVTIFNCTSPWEIYDYGLQTKVVSPLLEQHFYKRTFDNAATTAIRLEDVFEAVMEKLRQPAPTLT
jgi:heptosyltransferase-2